MNPNDFKYLTDIIISRSGIVLGEDKLYLLESRLIPIIKPMGMQTLENLVDYLRKNNDAKLIAEIIDAMTTNETSFFRDSKPFEQLRRYVLPKIIEQNSSTKKIKIWSAACSTGQEPYTTAMCLLEEAQRLSGWTYEIVATDLCSKVIERAKEGIYSQFEVQRGMPIQLLLKYFTQETDYWRINDSVKKNISFSSMNLLDDYSRMGTFDIIMCRNVLIYFNEETKRKVLEKLKKQLNKGGFLYLGSTETIFGISDDFIPVENERGLYTANNK